MTRLDCVQVDELLGAYALEALPPDQRRDLDAHLSACPEQEGAATGLRTAAARLVLLAGEVSPRVALRQRVMDAVRREPTPEPVPLRRVAAPGRRRLPPALARPAAALAGALAVALVAGTLLGYLLTRPVTQTWTFAGTGAAASATAELVYYPDRKTLLVSVSGLGRLAPGQVYELWLIDRQDHVLGEGVSDAPAGRIGTSLSIDPSRFATFAITIERGEQPAPTTPPILAGRLIK